MALSPLDDYIDGDVAYLLGLILGRGTISESGGVRKIIIEFPYTSLKVESITTSFDQETAIRLGIESIRERLLDLLDTDIKTVTKDGGVELIAQFHRPSMMWRNILYILENSTSYPYFRVPKIFYHSELPKDWKREFVRGYADVAGNVRKANRYVDGRHRVRLDILNYPTNWEIPMQLCLLLQDELEVPVQLITYGHPNLGRKFKEHQLNVFAEPFLKIGFSFQHKQKILEEFAEENRTNNNHTVYDYCPGKRRFTKTKPSDSEENNATKLDPRLVGHHFDAYWQICKALGCPRYPTSSQLLLDFDEDENE